MIYQVTHRTSYRYAAAVTSSYGWIHLLPQSAPGQVCHAAQVVVDPAPGDERERRDFFGNRALYFEILAPHDSLTVTATSTVEVTGRAEQLSAIGDLPWEAAVGPPPAAPFGPEAADAAQYLLDSPLAAATPELADYAAASFVPGRPVLEVASDLASRIHDDLAYRSGATDVRTTAGEALAVGAGVCQDFAHVAIAGLRAHGLAARYVSGYLETDPPPGRPRLQGADRSHAWASVHVPGHGWVDVDPTNRQLVNDRYITTAAGRDYRDVPPMRGIIHTEGVGQDLHVAVDVVRTE